MKCSGGHNQIERFVRALGKRVIPFSNPTIQKVRLDLVFHFYTLCLFRKCPGEKFYWAIAMFSPECGRDSSRLSPYRTLYYY